MILNFKSESDFVGGLATKEVQISIPGEYPGLAKRLILEYLLGCKISKSFNLNEVEDENGFDYLDNI
jgi:hypothetical protein